MNTLLLVQPGPYGDIFVCAPIAKWYADRGYRIYWPARKEFHSVLSGFDYVTPIFLREDKLHVDWLRSDVMKIIPMFGLHDKVVNLADRGPHKTAQKYNENFELCKYRIAEVPFDEKQKLTFTRNIEKEQDLYDMLAPKKGEPYAIVHSVDSRMEEASVPEINKTVVKVSVVPGYDIQDWFLLLSKASEIYCVESAMHQFVDGIISKVTEDRYLLRRPAVEEGTRFTVSKGWKLDYIGKDSIVKG